MWEWQRHLIGEQSKRAQEKAERERQATLPRPPEYWPRWPEVLPSDFCPIGALTGDDPTWWPLADGTDPRYDAALIDHLEARGRQGDRVAGEFIATLDRAMAGEGTGQLRMARMLQAGIADPARHGALAIGADPSRALFWFARAVAAGISEARSEGETLLRQLERQRAQCDRDAAGAPWFLVLGEPGYSVVLGGIHYRLVLHQGGALSGIGRSPEVNAAVSQGMSMILQGSPAPQQMDAMVGMLFSAFGLDKLAPVPQMNADRGAEVSVGGGWRMWRQAPGLGGVDPTPAIDLEVQQQLSFAGGSVPLKLTYSNGKWRDRVWRFFVLGRAGRVFSPGGLCRPQRLFARDDEGLPVEFRWGT